MLRVAGALLTNQVRADATCCGASAARAHPTLLGAAFAEYGRIDRTEHPLPRRGRRPTPCRGPRDQGRGLIERPW
ncbi:hypothetical protein ACIRQP_23695 [Streptomyces sp. NPDC102274]|uniref:hypothetical protein n=1 Tax=Streptomyces sp. NPDC102274 TaxID=3366151 RepID=UPI0037FBDD6B